MKARLDPASMPFGNLPTESQMVSVIQPKVASLRATLGLAAKRHLNPERVVSRHSGDATPLGLGIICCHQLWAERLNPVGIPLQISRKAFGLCLLFFLSLGFYPAFISATPAVDVQIPNVELVEPYPRITGGSFTGPTVRESPDPLVRYWWLAPQASDSLQVYTLKPVAIQSDAPKSFSHLDSLKSEHPNVTVNGTGSIRMDFGP